MDHEREISLKVLQAVLNEVRGELSLERIRKLQHDLSNRYPSLYILTITSDYQLRYNEEITKKDILKFIRFLWLYSKIFGGKNLVSVLEKIIGVISRDIIEREPKKEELEMLFALLSRSEQIAKLIELTFTRIFEKSDDSITNNTLMMKIMEEKNPVFRVVSIEEEKIRISAVAESILIDLYSKLLSLALEVYSQNLSRKNSYFIIFSSLKEIFELFEKIVDSFGLRERLLNGVYSGYISPDIYGFQALVGKIPEHSKIQIISNNEVRYRMMNALVKDIIERYGAVIVIGSKIIELPNVVNVTIGEKEDIKIKKIGEGSYVNIISTKDGMDEALKKANRIVGYYPIKCVVSEMGEYLSYFSEDYTKSYVGKQEEDNYDYTFNFKKKAVDVIIRHEKKRLYYEIKDDRIRFVKQREAVKIPAEFINPIEKIKKHIKRNYGYSLKSSDYLLFLRVPRSDIMEIDEEDIKKIKRKLDIEKLENKAYSVYLLSDNSYVEIEMPIFVDILKYVDLNLLKRIYKGIGAVGKRDTNIRRMLDDISEEFSRKRKGINRGSSGGGYVYSMGGRGKVVKYRPLMEGEDAVDIAILPTIRAAAIRSGGIVRKGNLLLDIRRGDIRQNIRRSRTETLLCTVIEAGGYKYINEKKSIIKHLMVSIFKDAYERRDEVALIAMNGDRARLVSDFTSDVEYVGAYVDVLEYGGLVPFASGIMKGLITLKKKIGDRPSATPILIVFTTGLANVPLVPGGYVNVEIEKIAKIIRSEDIPLIIVDISGKGSAFARKFAMLAGGRYYHPQTATYFT